jgi:hypothetical protein
MFAIVQDAEQPPENPSGKSRLTMNPANETKSIHLCFHSPCFDGVVSAAIASSYLEENRGYTHVALQPVNYHLKPQWLTTSFPHPFAVVDFLYHPSATIWADHHPTTFISDEVRKDFENRPSPDRFYDRNASSCALLIWRRWGEALPAFSEHFEPIVAWADRIDSARYDSVEEAITLAEPALRISLALGTSRDETICQRLVSLLRHKSLAEVADLPEIKAAFQIGFELQQRGLERLAHAVQLTGSGIAVFDVNADDVMVNRYAPFHFFPQARYSAGIVRTGNKAKLTAMRNPWLEFPSAPLGQLCAPLGGGGHQRVGSIVIENRDPRETLDKLLKAVDAWSEET